MYEDVTYDVILNRMLDRVSNKFDKREGSVIWDTHSPTAIELEILYIELDNILKEAFGDTADREYLILRCAERGITPYDASYAVLKGEFTPGTIDVTGQRFSIEDINYVVLDRIDNESSDTVAYYYVQCETAGSIGNRYLGSMIPIDYIDGLTSAELIEVSIPGEDEEDTEALRERYFESFDEKAFGGNVKDYIEKTNAISGVGGTKVTRVWNGDIRPAEMIPSDAVTSWYNSTIGGLSDEVAEWLSTVYTAAAEKKLTVGGTVLLTIIDSEYNSPSSALVDLVQTTIDPEQNAGEGYGEAPIGHVVNVKGVESVDVDIITTITFESGYSWSTLSSAITDAIEDYLLELRKEWATEDHLVVRSSQLENHILSVNGVIDVQNTSLNGGETDENLVLGEYEIPVLGEITVAEGVRLRDA
ncbi:MAG: baseplate J/gp47 family protein [Bacteroidales bacterium]|nr:baseplate J/gp47 family protein [Bacteroidales bacterium]